MQGFFKEFFPDAMPFMPTLVDDFRHNPTSSLAYVRCSPWHYKDGIVLIGDACHAVVPFYGQGMNAAFEDCSTLASLIQKFPSRRTVAFAEYEAQRRVARMPWPTCRCRISLKCGTASPIEASW